MDQKKLNLTLIFSLILFGIGMAFKSIATFFGGIVLPYGSFGIPFVAVLVFTLLILANGLKNKENRRRLIDIFILVGISLIFAIVAYCSTEWTNQLDVNLDDINFINEWCISYSIFSTIFFIYAILRYISEISDKKWTIFEYILFLKKVEKSKVTVSEKYNRQPKEVINGDLEQKPNQTEDVKAEVSGESVEENNQAESEKVQEIENNNSNFNQY